MIGSTKAATAADRQTGEAGSGLRRGQFRRIAANGFGDQGNAYPHAMAWFDGSLYVGTTRHVLVLLYRRSESFRRWKVFPVRIPREGSDELDIRGRIWRWDPADGSWTETAVSPMTTGSDGSPVPVFQGFRNMAVFRGAGDDRPCLYTLTWSPRKGPGACFLRSEDGRRFEQVPIRGFAASAFTTFRPLVEFRGRLFTAPTGKSGSGNNAGVSIIIANDDPAGGEWVQVNETDFGDPRNLSITEMTVFDGRLYAATSNPEGFQLWRTDGEGTPPYRWERVLAGGAGRGACNEAVGSMAGFGGALYIGTVIQNGGYDETYAIGPAASELIRVRPDGSWDLLVGDGRMTADGFRTPLSGYGPGFDFPFNTYFWRLTVHRGRLYLGTFNSSVFVPYPPRDEWPAERRSVLDDGRERELVSESGGFHLWRSRDGVEWIPVTRDGFSNPFNYGVRTLVSAPPGLFVGAANPFGPEIAVRRSGGWTHEPNPRGGLEIWFAPDGPAAGRDPDGRPDAVPGVRDAGRRERERAYVRHAVAGYYDGAGWRPIGLWTPDTADAPAACRNLLEEIASLCPPGTAALLDLGCGSGETTRALARRLAVKTAVGVRFAPAPETAAPPPVSFLDAARPPLPLAAGSFDAVVGIETLSACPAGPEWIAEAFRLLRPGGCFVAAVPLSPHADTPWKRRAGRRLLPVETAAEFAALLAEAGFADILASDAQASLTEFHSRLNRTLFEKTLRHECDGDLAEEIRSAVIGPRAPVCAYVLCRAARPEGGPA